MDALMLARLQFAITTVYHFFFVPLTLGLSILVALMETFLCAHWSGSVQTDDQVLGEAVRHQFCHGCGDRHCAGISVWHELVGIFTFCGGYLRRSAGD